MNETEKNEKLVYEVGYHIIPTIDEMEVPSEALKIKSFIEDKGGSIISEEMPKTMVLAYEISKNIGSKKHDFNKAYFGWIKFEIEPSEIASIKNKLDSTVEVLRFIIIKTVRENTIHIPKIPMFKKENSKENKDVKEEEGAEQADKPKASEAEIDKSIDELVIS